MASNKWTEDTSVKFVELYREHECLWNSNLLVYRNKQARDAAIKKLVEEMGIEGFGAVDAKNKIKNLRSTYMQEVAKIKKANHSGMGAEDSYVPKMKWFAIMHSFLQKVNKRRDTLSNLVSILPFTLNLLQYL